MRSALIVVVAAAVIGGAVTGAVWWFDTDPAGSPPATAPRLTAPATEAETAGADSTPAAPAPTSAASEQPKPRPATQQASCATSELFAVVDANLERSAEVRLASVEVTHCRHGYARVIAVPDTAGCGHGGGCFEHEQVFLHDVGGGWVILTSGTGIDCATDPDLPAPLDEACRGLGLRADRPYPGIWPASWEELAAVQAAVDHGHQPWRSDAG